MKKFISLIVAVLFILVFPQSSFAVMLMDYQNELVVVNEYSERVAVSQMRYNNYMEFVIAFERYQIRSLEIDEFEMSCQVHYSKLAQISLARYKSELIMLIQLYNSRIVSFDMSIFGGQHNLPPPQAYYGD